MPARILSRIYEGMSPGQARIAGFIALSIALHLLTALGAGPLDLSARRFGDAPGRTELHATLERGESARPASGSEQSADQPNTDADAAAAPAPAAAEGTITRTGLVGYCCARACGNAVASAVHSNINDE